MKNHKKIISLLLILCLLFCFASCGAKDNQSEDGQQSGDVIENNTDNTAVDEDGDGFVDDGEIVAIPEEELNSGESDAFVSFDFGARFAVNFPLDATIQKVDYSDIKSLGDKLQSLGEAFSEKAGKNLVFFNDYEEDSESDLDLIVYAVGMQDNNETLDYLETGVFHNQSDSNYVQYCVYMSSNLRTVDDESVDSFIDFAKENLGVEFDKEKLVKAIERALKDVVELEEVYVNQTQIVKGSGYSDKVTLSVQAFEEVDGNYLYYIDIDRERTYN